MHSNLYEEKNDFLSIVAASFIFHFLVIAALVVAVLLKPAKENPPPIPFFEMINVAPPPPSPSPSPARPQTPVPQTPAPAPKPDAQSAPVPKPAPTPINTKPNPTPITEPIAPAPSMDMPMDLPPDIKSKDMNMPALRTLGNITMDPQMQAYLERLLRLIYQNFNPPAGTEIARGTKSSVHFQIARNGEIMEVVLRSSSGNSVWDRLAVRAVQITKPPPLPPSYTAENLPLIFDFKEK